MFGDIQMLHTWIREGTFLNIGLFDLTTTLRDKIKR
jgi:hypothetical protein